MTRKSAAILLAILLEIVALILVAPRGGRFIPHGSGKGFFAGGLALTFVYALFLGALYLGLRGKSRALGILVVIVAVAWVSGGLAAILSNTESIFLGMLSIAGIFAWLPLAFVGVALALEAPRGEQ